MTDPTTPEVMVHAMAQEAAKCTLVAQGIATPLVTASLILAKRCFAPDLTFAFAIGNSYGDQAGRFSLIDPEANTLTGALCRWDFCEGAGEFLPHENPAEFFRPGQIDATGATNNVVIGPYENPKVRLPGSAGIPDVSPTSHTARVYVPRHTTRVFVEELDFCSGAGSATGPGPVRVFTNLCTMTLQEGRLGVELLMPGVRLEEVQEATGFELAAGRAPGVVELPSKESLRMLREEVDPLELRNLDFLPMRERLQRLWEVCREEEQRWTEFGSGW